MREFDSVVDSPQPSTLFRKCPASSLARIALVPFVLCMFRLFILFIISLAAARLAAANPEGAAGPVKLSPPLLQVASHLGEGGAHFSFPLH